MITRIELHNFMSHRHTVIEPSAGLTVLIGPNNCGKSALVAALQILCHNENSTYVKRHGAKECAVIVHTSDGNVIEWRRKTSPRYLINGQEHSRLGNAGIPAELHPLLRLPLVADEADDSFDVHFGSQKSPIFLLNSKAGTAAKFFASSSDAIRLLQMQQRHKEKATEARKQHQRLEAEAAIVAAELEVLEGTVPLADQLAELELRFDECGRIEAESAALAACEAQLLDRLESSQRYAAHVASLSQLASPPELVDPRPLEELIQRLEMTGRLGERLTDECSALASLPAAPEMADEDGLEQLADQLGATSARIERLTEQRRTLKDLSAVPVLEDSIALEATLRQVERLHKQVATTESRCQLLADLNAPPAVEDSGPLESLARKIDEQQGEVEQAQRRFAAVTKLAEPPAIDDETGLSQQVNQLTAAVNRFEELGSTVGSLSSELAEVAEQIRNAVRGESCPTCGQPFDADQLLEMTAGQFGGACHG